MFQDVFGTVSPFFIASVVTALVQFIKAGWKEWKGTELPRFAIQGIVALLNMAFGIPFHIFYTVEFNWFVPVEAILFSLAMAFYSMGLFTVFKGD